LPDSFRHRAEDQFRGDALARHAAVRTARGMGGGQLPAAQDQFRQLSLSVERFALRAGVLELAQGGIRLDDLLFAHRVSDGVRDRSCKRELAQYAALARHLAVLDVVSAARVCVDGLAQQSRPDQSDPDGARHHRRAARALEHRSRHVYRHRLFVPAVHDPAALFESREARSDAARGCGRLGLPSISRLPQHHAAALETRRHRRIDARVHSGGRGIRDPAPARRHRFVDDRPRALGRVLPQSQLADCERGRDCAFAAARDPDHDLPALSGAGNERGAQTMNSNRSFFLLTSLVLGFAFLYIPILSMIIFSFNDSKLVTVWGGFSVKWYGELLGNRRMLEAAWLS